MALDNEERQVSATIDEIRRDHVARYEFAAKIIPPGQRVIDFACGVGYGSSILSKADNLIDRNYVDGFDRDRDAIDYAREHYSGKDVRVLFEVKDAELPGELDEYDAAVCFETIEHIENPRPLLKALRKSKAEILIASVPNEDIFPWLQPDGTGLKYHFRHYNRHDFKLLLEECGWRVDSWHGQEGPESDVEEGVIGRTIVVVCSPGEIPKEKAPGQHIAIIGLGPSAEQYLDITKRQGGRQKFCDQTWTINALGDVFACDLVFHMDDIRIQEIRAAARPDSNIAAMVKWLKTTKIPVVTSRAHPDYPALIAFPLEEILNELGHDYFNSTAAYTIALAIHVGATKISIFGMDFSYASTHDAEKGRACVEFWLGVAHARGIEICMPASTSLMDACHSRAERLYGYDTVDIQFNIDSDGVLRLGFTERETLPNAEQIEKAYDHSAPISDQHIIEKGGSDETVQNTNNI